MKKCIPVLLMLTILICGCSKQAQESTSEPVSDTFFAMDTTMDFRIYGDKSLLQDAQNVITDLEKKVSVTDSDSEIYKINENGSGILSGEADTLMKNALEMCRRTNGALDISIYPIVKAWGFTTGSYQVPDEETIQTLLTKVDYTQIQYDEASGNVTISEGMTIDLGSIAKGYAGELAARTLRDKGVTSALLNLGGNVQTIGSKPDGSAWIILWILLPDILPRAGFCPSQSLGTKEEFAMPSPLHYLSWVWIKRMTSGRKVMISKPCS